MLFSWPRRHTTQLTPVSDIERTETAWRTTGSSPTFLLSLTPEQVPAGWVIVAYETDTYVRWFQPTFSVSSASHPPETYQFVLRRPLYVRPLSPATKEEAPAANQGGWGSPTRVEIGFLVRLPPSGKTLHLQVTPLADAFQLEKVTVCEIGLVAAVMLSVWRYVRLLLFHPHSLGWFLWEASVTVRNEGYAVLWRRLLFQEASPTDYAQWIAAYDTFTPSDAACLRRRLQFLTSHPVITVIVVVEDPTAPRLQQTLASMRNQVYPHWKLVMVVTPTAGQQARQFVEQSCATDKRIGWVQCPQEDDRAAVLNEIIGRGAGDFITVLKAGDTLPEHALATVVLSLRDRPDAVILYSDEDVIDEHGQRQDPYLKPDWNPDLFLQQNFLSRLGVYRTQQVRACGAFRREAGEEWAWDLALRLVTRVPPAQIQHIPHILYHRLVPKARKVEGGTTLTTARLQVLSEALAQRKDKARVLPEADTGWRVLYPLPQQLPRVTIIIPTRNGVRFLRRCVDSLMLRTQYPAFELLIVDNQSDDPQTLAYLQQARAEQRTRVVTYDAPFNYSSINNFGVRSTRGEVLAFLNDDMEIITPGWLDEMVRHALRPEVGAVGAMLYYPNDTIQHAGVIVGILGGAGHAYHQKPRGESGQRRRAKLVQNVSAVTAACLVIRRVVFEEVGGFDEGHLPIVFNDVDLCLRLRERGYWNVWTPYAELYHYESASRGYEDTIEKQLRFCKERVYMRRRWNRFFRSDPAYNPNLTLDRGDFTLVFPPRVCKPWR